MATKQKFGVGVLIGTTRTDALGVALAVPQSFRLGILQDISSDFSFESKPLYGSGQLPVDQGRGKAKLTFSAKSASIDAIAFAALHFGIAPTTGVKLPLIDFAATVPATPYQVTPTLPGSGTWLSDLGVTTAAGVPLTRVASGPATGQYSVSAGVYTFAAADTGVAMLISLLYSAATGGTIVQMTNQLMGYSPSFGAILYNDSKGSKLCVGMANCQSDKLSLPFKNDDFALADFGFMGLDDGSGSAGWWCQT